MRIPGRFWWVAALAACVFGAAAVAWPTFFLASTIPLDLEIGVSPKSDLAFAALFALFPLGLSLFLALYSAATLRKYRLRKRTLRGDIEVTPLAIPLITSGAVPDVIAAPLVLRWRLKLNNGFTGVAVALCLCATVVPALVMMGGFIFILWAQAQQTDLMSFVGRHTIQLVGMLVIFVFLFVMCSILLRVVWTQWRHGFGVSATVEGLECVHESGRWTFIPWSDARLFEVESHAASPVSGRTWRLYGSHDIAEWKLHPVRNDQLSAQPDGISAIEARLRMDALVRLIEARTGLQPRTLSKALMATTSTSPSRRRWPGLACAVLATLSLVVAVAVLVLPLTDIAWLNIALALPLIFCAIQLVRLITAVRRSMPERSEHVSIASDPAIMVAINDTSTYGRAYGFIVGPSRAALLRIFATGAPLAIEFLPVARPLLSALPDTALAHALRFTSSSASPQPLVALAGRTLTWTLLAYGIGGLLLCIAAFYASGAMIRADDVGLSWVSGSITVAYPWSDMAEIRERSVRDDTVSYAVHNRAGAVVLTFPARADSVMSVSPAPNLLSITPVELAQIIRQRIAETQAS